MLAGYRHVWFLRRLVAPVTMGSCPDFVRWRFILEFHQKFEKLVPTGPSAFQNLGLRLRLPRRMRYLFTGGKSSTLILDRYARARVEEMAEGPKCAGLDILLVMVDPSFRQLPQLFKVFSFEKIAHDISNQ